MEGGGLVGFVEDEPEDWPVEVPGELDPVNSYLSAFEPLRPSNGVTLPVLAGTATSPLDACRLTSLLPDDGEEGHAAQKEIHQPGEGIDLFVAHTT